MAWFEYTQNNSGGNFHVDEKVCHRLFIEADTVEQANEKAEDLGCYWGGVSAGVDCGCCGDRWYKPWGEEEFPVDCERDGVYNTVEEYAQYLADQYGWTKPDARIYYADGRVREVFTTPKGK